MIFIFGIPVAIGILWIATMTVWGRWVSAISIVLIGAAVYGAINAENAQDAARKAAREPLDARAAAFLDRTAHGH